MADVQLTDDIRAALESATYEPEAIRLSGQLQRTLYQRTNAFIEAAGGRWDRKRKMHVFPSEPRAALGLIVSAGVVVDERKKFQAFYTPPDLASRVVALADVKGRSVLDPSCGDGALLLEALKQGAAKVTGIDINPKAVAATTSGFALLPGHQSSSSLVLEADFLVLKNRVGFERVVMNPPFTRGADLEHVRHAFQTFLVPGGKLVAIMTPRGADTFAREIKAGIIPVPAGEFRSSGTDIATAIVVGSKPLSAPWPARLRTTF